MVKRVMKQATGVALTAALVVGMVASAGGEAQAKAKTVKLSTKSMSVTVGKTKTLKVKNNRKKVVWTVKSGKKMVTLTKKKKSSVTIKGRKAGKAEIQAKADGKKLICKVTVKKKGKKPVQSQTPVKTNPPVQSENPPVQSEKPPVQSEKPTAEPVKNLKIDLTKCGETTFTTSPAKIDFSSQIDSRFDLKLYDEMVVGYKMEFNGEVPSGYTGKIALAESTDTLTGYADGVAYNYNLTATGNSVSLDLTGEAIEGTAVGINIQPMDKDLSWGWPTTLNSVTITSIEFIATPGAVYPAEGGEVVATPVPNPTYAPETFSYEGLDTSWIDPNKPMVAFTFDDGPVGNADTDTSMVIQSALKKHGAHATFFYIGSKINSDKTEKEIRQAVANGFEIGNHSWSYNPMGAMKEASIKKSIGDTNAKLSELSGFSNFLFRAPNLQVSNTMKGYIKAPFIDCAVDSKDWDKATKEQIIENVKKATDGDIVLMHETEKNTAAAVEELLQYFDDKGWQVVSVSEMFAAKKQKLITGTVFKKCP